MTAPMDAKLCREAFEKWYTEFTGSDNRDALGFKLNISEIAFVGFKAAWDLTRPVSQSEVDGCITPFNEMNAASNIKRTPPTTPSPEVDEAIFLNENSARTQKSGDNNATGNGLSMGCSESGNAASRSVQPVEYTIIGKLESERLPEDEDGGNIAYNNAIATAIGVVQEWLLHYGCPYESQKSAYQAGLAERLTVRELVAPAAYMVTWDKLDREYFASENSAKSYKKELDENGWLNVKVVPLYQIEAMLQLKEQADRIAREQIKLIKG